MLFPQASQVLVLIRYFVFSPLHFSKFIGKKETFFIAPGAFMDVTANDVTPSVMIALGVNW